VADTVRSLAALQALLADNASGDISAQDARDFLISAYQPAAIIPGGRLTLESGVSVSTSDQTAKTSVYYTPHTHNRIGLYDGTSWTLHAFAELTLALGTLTSGKNYDVFLYDNAGTLTLEFSAAWTNDTTRADALTTQDGVYVKSGATTRRYLGTIRTTSTTTTEDSCGGSTTQVGGKRFVWNHYNRVHRPIGVVDLTNSWTYAVATTWRQSNAAAGNKVEVVVGLAGAVIKLRSCNMVNSDSTTTAVLSAIGEDSTTTRVAAGVALIAAATSSTYGSASHDLTKYVPLGYHYYSWNEWQSSSATITYRGDDGGDGRHGLDGWIES
jgi:hypothetical protein